MARRPRIQFPGAVYHVMSRGNRKSMIVDDDDDRRTFMNTFSEAARDYQVRVYACCLMGTHYHTLLDTPRGNLSEFIRTVNTEYSKAFNRRHERVGHTFEQRFHSLVVQREKYLRRVARYIALNPVKACLCREAADWPDWKTRPRGSIWIGCAGRFGPTRYPTRSAAITRTCGIRPGSRGRSTWRRRSARPASRRPSRSP
jgi:REP element-mobilizing transposase RayT